MVDIIAEKILLLNDKLENINISYSKKLNKLGDEINNTNQILENKINENKESTNNFVGETINYTVNELINRIQLSDKNYEDLNIEHEKILNKFKIDIDNIKDN